MLLYSAWAVHRNSHVHIFAVVAQSVERFLGKEEVRQFKSAQQLQHKKKVFISVKTFFFILVILAVTVILASTPCIPVSYQYRFLPHDSHLRVTEAVLCLLPRGDSKLWCGVYPPVSRTGK